MFKVKLRLFKPTWSRILPQLKFLAAIVFLSSAVTFSKTQNIRAHLPASKESEPVVIDQISSPAPNSFGNTFNKTISKDTQTVSGKIAVSSNPLCKGLKDPWTLIADPSHEGEYVICNVVPEKMTTVEELNSAQNEYRKDHSLNSLSIDSQLCMVASQRAKEISTNFSHDGFEAAVDRNGVNRSAVGENIASGPLAGVHFVQWAWDRSPGHKGNMLGDWSVGCGGVYDKFAVFIFAR